MHELSTFDFQVNEIRNQQNMCMEEALLKLKKAGYTHLDADVNTLTPENQKIIDGTGIAVNLIYAAPDFSVDHEELEEKILTRCQRAHADFLMLIPVEHPAEQEKSIQNNIRCMNSLVQKLSTLGVTPVMEDFDSWDKSYATVQGLRRYLDEVPGLKCCFDTGNFHFSGAGTPEAYPQLKDKIVHVHLKDLAQGSTFGPGREHAGAGICCNAPTGDGILGIDRFLADLVRDGYRGRFALEHAPMYDQFAACLRSAERVREILRNLHVSE